MKSNNPNLAEEGKPYRWKKGQSGNPAGRAKSKILSDAYRNRLEEPVPNDPQRRTWAELIADAQIREAAKGKTQAAEAIADRTEGKPRLSVEIGAGDNLAEAIAERRKILDEYDTKSR